MCGLSGGVIIMCTDTQIRGLCGLVLASITRPSGYFHIYFFFLLEGKQTQMQEYTSGVLDLILIHDRHQ